VLLTAFSFVAGSVLLSRPVLAEQFTNGQKATIKGTITARSGDLVRVQDKKSGETSVLKITDDTKIERLRGKIEFFRRTDMDVTALIPGLTVDAEGVGNDAGQLEVRRIKFNPDIFAIEVAEEQQVVANQAAAQQAQSSANAAAASAADAQSTADSAQALASTAQASANQAGVAAIAAEDIGMWDAAAVQMVNQRVSDLNDYKTIAEADIYFPTNSSALDGPAKADLDALTAAVADHSGYLIEIAGYTSATGSAEFDRKLSNDRAAAVADYLRDKDNIPMRRILAPVGYGAYHPAATNTDPQGRALNRRVEVRVLINRAEAGQ
jgi:outer membrane protein OmpA-like peptidoglycan-associated protein